MEPRDPFLLEQIVEFCDRIIDTSGKLENYEAFCNDLDAQDLCAFRILQIGEYIHDLSQQFKDTHPEMAWHEIVNFRNIVAHDYGSIDLEIVWDTIKTSVPELRDYCFKLIK